MAATSNGSNMKTKTTTKLSFGIFAVSLALLAPISAHSATTRLDARSGSKMRLEGTSTIHDWQVESPLILGYIEVGPNFPLEPGQTVTPAKVEAKGEAIVVVQSLRSINKDGKPYEAKMDDKMYHMMSYTNYPKI